MRIKRLMKAAALALSLTVSLSTVTPAYAATPGQASSAEKVRYGKVSAEDTELIRPMFDATYYAANNPDVVADRGSDPEKLFDHFITAGIFEGRAGNKGFNVSAYRSSYSDLENEFKDEIVKYYIHYQRHGKGENRKLTTVEKAVEAGKTVRSAVEPSAVIAKPTPAPAPVSTPVQAPSQDSTENEKPAEQKPAENDKSKVEKVVNNDGSYQEHTYDPKGNMVKKTFYDAAGNEIGNISYSYDTDGSLKWYDAEIYNDNNEYIGWQRYNAQDTITYAVIYNSDGYRELEYDDGILYVETYWDTYGTKVNKRIFYNKDGTIKSQYTMEYDENGRKSIEKFYNAENELVTISTYTYVEGQDKYTEVQTLADGSFLNKYEYENGKKVYCGTWLSYSSGKEKTWLEEFYDENGHPVKSYFYSGDENSAVDFIYEYEYDANGREKLCYHKDGDGKLLGTSVCEYDEKGNKVKETYYDADGKEMYYYTLEYDENNNYVGSTRHEVEQATIKTVSVKLKTKSYTVEGDVGKLDSQTTYSYDEHGNLVDKAEDLGFYAYNEHYTNDSLGRVVKDELLRADDSYATFTHYGAPYSYTVFEYSGESKDPVKATGYTADGNLSWEDNYSYEFDESGRITKKIINGQLETAYEYDDDYSRANSYFRPDGAVRMVIEIQFTLDGSEFRVCDHHYNEQGQEVGRQIYKWMSSSTGEYTQYTATLGRVSTGGFHELVYDEAGNEIERKRFSDDDGDGKFSLSGFDRTEWTTLTVTK